MYKKNLNLGNLSDSDDDAAPPVNRKESISKFVQGIKATR